MTFTQEHERQRVQSESVKSMEGNGRSLSMSVESNAMKENKRERMISVIRYSECGKCDALLGIVGCQTRSNPATMNEGMRGSKNEDPERLES